VLLVFKDKEIYLIVCALWVKNASICGFWIWVCCGNPARVGIGKYQQL